MLQPRRRALQLGRNLLSRQQRRHDSKNTSSGHAASAGHAEPVHHGHHPEPVNESFGRGFYITLAAIPLLIAIYKFSASTSSDPAQKPFLTRLIKRFSEHQETIRDRNARHTAMAEQAAFDRNLFQSSPASRMVELKFPEVFNTGSPYNVPAGHSANLEEVIAHYTKLNKERQEAQLRKVERR